MTTPRSIDIRLILSGILELLGIGGIAFGASLVYLPAGVIIGGIGLLWIARAVDPPIKQRVVVEE